MTPEEIKQELVQMGIDAYKDDWRMLMDIGNLLACKYGMVNEGAAFCRAGFAAKESQ